MTEQPAPYRPNPKLKRIESGFEGVIFNSRWLMAPAAEKVGPRGALSPAGYLSRLEQANVVNSLDNLMTFPRLRKLIERGSVTLHGAYFGVATGDLWVLDKSSGKFEPIKSAALGPSPRF